MHSLLRPPLDLGLASFATGCPDATWREIRAYHKERATGRPPAVH